MRIGSRENNAAFARAVVDGLRRKGYDDAAAAAALGLSSAKYARLAKGEIAWGVCLSDRVLAWTGLTAGQLGALSVDPGREGFAQLMDELAGIRITTSDLAPPLQRRPRKAAKRSAPLAPVRPRARRSA